MKSLKVIFKIVLVLFIVVLALSYLLLRTSPVKRIGKLPEDINLKVLGDPAKVREIIQNPASREEVDVKVGSFIRKGQSTLSVDLCRVPPECTEVVKKARGPSGLDPERVDKKERWCLWECLGPEEFIERETMTLRLTGEQITKLIELYKPESVPASDIQIIIDEDGLSGSAYSGYSILKGLLAAEAKVSLTRFDLTKVYFGRIPLNEKMTFWVEDAINSLIFDYLESIWVTVSRIRQEGNVLVVTAEVPKGLLKVEGDELVVNSDILASLVANPKFEFNPEPWTKWDGGSNDGNYEIQPLY